MRRVVGYLRLTTRDAQAMSHLIGGPPLSVRPTPYGTRLPESNSPLPSTHERQVDGREVGVKRISKVTRELQLESPARRLVVEKKTDGAIPHEADISPVDFEKRSDPHARRREDSEEQDISLTSPAFIGSEVRKQGVQLRRGRRWPSSVSRLPDGQAIAASNLLGDFLDRTVHVLDRFNQTQRSELGRECPAADRNTVLRCAAVHAEMGDPPQGRSTVEQMYPSKDLSIRKSVTLTGYPTCFSASRRHCSSVHVYFLTVAGAKRLAVRRL